MNIGIIGGLGPLATAYLMELVINMTQAERDQEHIPMLVYNYPQVPDRTAYILDHSKENPVPYIIQAGKEMKKLHIDVMAMPCITAHYFHDEIEKGIGDVRLINMISCTAKYLAEQGVHSVGLTATDGTVQCGLFQRVMEQEGLQVLTPEAESQQKIMDIIYKNVKAGKPVDMESFYSVSSELRMRGAQVIILGCTELSLIKRENHLRAGYIDAMEVLAREIILAAGKELRPEYECLITK